MWWGSAVLHQLRVEGSLSLCGGRGMLGQLVSGFVADGLGTWWLLGLALELRNLLVKRGEVVLSLDGFSWPRAVGAQDPLVWFRGLSLQGTRSFWPGGHV